MSDDDRAETDQHAESEIDLRPGDRDALSDLRDRLARTEQKSLAANRPATATAARLRRYEVERSEAEYRLRALLVTVVGWAETLSERWNDLDQDRRNAGLRIIHRRASEGIERLERMMSSPRPSELELADRAELVEVRALLLELATEYGGISPAHTITVDASSDARAWADRSLLEEVLASLIDNAVKWSPDGGTIVLRARLEDNDLHISVSDEGVGVPEGLDVTRYASQLIAAGAPMGGLGLYVVGKIADRIGATITFTRNEGRGSTVLVQLPRDRRLGRRVSV